MKWILSCCLCICMLYARGQNITQAEYFFNTDPGVGNGVPVTVAVPGTTTDISFNAATNALPAGFHILGFRTKNANGVWGLFETRGVYISTSTANVGNVVAAEFFMDADPGPGLGTAMNIGASGGTVNFSAGISTNLLSPGFHNIGIRTKDADGKWGFYEIRAFYISSSTSNVADISGAEFFIDADPGPGLGTAMNIGTSGATVNFSAGIPTISLTPGFHNLSIRTRTSDGKWGFYETRVFYISSSTGNVADITAAEFFIDADPGVGAGTAMTVNPAGAVVNLTASIPSNSLSQGFHNLCIRTRAADGKWGLFESRNFYLMKPAVNMPDVVAAEYFLDIDPGVGNAFPLVVNTPGSTVTQSFICDIPPATTNGNHMLFTRVKDAGGNWSHWDSSLVVVDVSQTPSSITNTPVNPNPCKGSSFVVNFNSTGLFGVAQNVFTAQLSDANGSFANPVAIGTVSALPSGTNTAGVVTVTIPVNTPNGTGYRIRILSSAPAFVGSPNAVDMKIIKPVTSAITGAIETNRGQLYPYSVTSTAGNTYAWTFANGTQNSGTNTSSVTATFNVAGTQSVSVTETTEFGCSGDQVSKNVTVYQLAITNIPATLTPCKGSTINIPITSTGVFDPGNIFTAQLSDANGGFGNPVAIGTVSANPVGSLLANNISATIPGGTLNGSGYRIRIVSSSPVFTGADNGTNITIIKPVTSAITGAIETNRGQLYPYSVTNTAGNTYAWTFANGTQNSGTNTSSVTATFNVAGTQSVSVTESTQFGCSGDAVSKNVTVYQLAITNTPSTLSPCPGTGFTVDFSSTGVYDAGNVFTAQLSDASGSFAAPVNIGSVNASPAGSSIANSINAILPASTPDGNGYRIRVVSNAPSVTGSNSAAITVTTSDVFTLTQNITVNGNLDMSTANPALFPCWRGGKLVLGNFNLTVNGNITGFDASHFVVTNGTGSFKLVNANSSNTYPVGTAVGNPNFVRLTNTGAADNFSVSVKEEVLRNGTTGSPVLSGNVNRTWNITEEVPGGSNASVTLLWSAADEQSGFTRNACVMAHFTTGPDWDFATQKGAAASEAGGQFSQTGNFTSFSPFTVTNDDSSTLPLTLVQFTGTRFNGYNLLQWSTANEKNINEFVLERSKDGWHFNSIGNKKAAGGSSNAYSYPDAAVPPGITFYYRLKITDNDGKFNYSPIVRLNGSNLLVVPSSLYPNPAGHITMLAIGDNKLLGTKAIITDIKGRQLQLITITATVQQVQLSGYAGGVYLLKLANGETLKILKE